MFLGSFQTRVDEKGRLKVPADFKRELEEGQKFLVTSLDGSKAQVYPVKEWMRKMETVLKMPPSHPVREKFMNLTSFWGQTAELDGQGRITLPQKLRESANLMAEEVIVIGKLLDPGSMGYLEVENYAQFSRKVEAAPMTAEDFDAMAAFGA
jgi:MraZ protein